MASPPTHAKNTATRPQHLFGVPVAPGQSVKIPGKVSPRDARRLALAEAIGHVKLVDKGETVKVGDVELAPLDGKADKPKHVKVPPPPPPSPKG